MQLPETDTWITKTSSPNATVFIGGYASAVFDTKIYVIGGLSEDQNYSLNQIYNTVTDTWSYGTSPPSGVGGDAAATTTGNLAPKQIYVIGVPLAFYPSAPLYSNQVYDPEKYNWRVATDLPTRRFNFGVAVINDTLYAIGGHTYDLPGFLRQALQTNNIPQSGTSQSFHHGLFCLCFLGQH